MRKILQIWFFDGRIWQSVIFLAFGMWDRDSRLFAMLLSRAFFLKSERRRGRILFCAASNKGAGLSWLSMAQPVSGWCKLAPLGSSILRSWLSRSFPFSSWHRHDTAAKRLEVSISSDFNCLGGTNLYTRKTVQSLVRLLIIRLHFVRLQNHQIVWTNVHTCCFVSTFAPIAFIRNDKGWHEIPPTPAYQATDWPVIRKIPPVVVPIRHNQSLSDSSLNHYALNWQKIDTLSTLSTDYIHVSPDSIKPQASKLRTHPS